nr:tRNA lysidine(34) synthetase TilS [Sinobaca sp. H24]
MEAPKRLDVPGTVTFNGWTITADWHEGFINPEQGDVFCIKESDVRLPLLVRSRIQGEKLHVAGMTGRKKLNRLFIDEKSLNLKGTAGLLWYLPMTQSYGCLCSLKQKTAKSSGRDQSYFI